MNKITNEKLFKDIISIFEELPKNLNDIKDLDQEFVLNFEKISKKIKKSKEFKTLQVSIQNKKLKKIKENNLKIKNLLSNISKKLYLNKKPIIKKLNKIYCYCNNSFNSNMIGCDNIECKIKWFHIDCVGMRDLEYYKTWFCLDCKNK